MTAAVGQPGLERLERDAGAESRLVGSGPATRLGGIALAAVRSLPDPARRRFLGAAR